MTQRCRLLVRAQIDGTLFERGSEFTLEDGELGPHRARVMSHETIDLAHDNVRIPGETLDEPLYEVWSDGKWTRPDTAPRTEPSAK